MKINETVKPIFFVWKLRLRVSVKRTLVQNGIKIDQHHNQNVRLKKQAHDGAKSIMNAEKRMEMLFARCLFLI